MDARQKGSLPRLEKFLLYLCKIKTRENFTAQMLTVVVRYKTRYRHCPICPAYSDGLENAAI